MVEFRESQELYDIALKLVTRIDRVSHIDVKEVLFLDEIETTPKALARCYALQDLPIQFFTDKKYCVVVYRANTDSLSPQQLVLLVLHELMHIPMEGRRVIDHDVKDFVALLNLNRNWSKPGVEVPDILEIGDNQGFSEESTLED